MTPSPPAQAKANETDTRLQEMGDLLLSAQRNIDRLLLERDSRDRRIAELEAENARLRNCVFEASIALHDYESQQVVPYEDDEQIIVRMTVGKIRSALTAGEKS